MKRSIIVSFLTVALFACSSNTKNRLIIDYKYVGTPNYFPDKDYDRRIDTLIMAFSYEYDTDTINVIYNGIDTTIIISTDEISGFAYDLRLGGIKNSSATLKLNCYDAIELIVDNDNQIYLIERHDSILKIRSRYNLPRFH